MAIRILIVLVLTVLQALAEDKDQFFRYYVFDQTKTDKLDYEFVRDCSIYAQENPTHLNFSTQYRIQGCVQKSFSYQEEQNEYQLSRSAYDAFLKVIRETNFWALKSHEGTSCKTGLLNIGDKLYGFNNPLGDPVRDRLHAAVLSLLKTTPPIKHIVTSYVIEGDFEPPREVTVEELINVPAKYDGKRIRVTGYYHSEFEESCLADKKGDDFVKSVWVSSESSFASKADIQWIEDGRVTIEGTFSKGAGGHWGEGAGDIQRLTKFSPLDPIPSPPPPANQSSKRK